MEVSEEVKRSPLRCASRSGMLNILGVIYVIFQNYYIGHFNQGIGIKGREMALVWHEKASRTALQTSLVSHTHTLLVQTHNMTTVKYIFLEYL